MTTPLYLDTKIQNENEALAISHGFYLWNSGGGIYGYAMDFKGCQVFIGSASSPENFEETPNDSQYWGFDITSDDGHVPEFEIEGDTDLESALINAVKAGKQFEKNFNQ